MKTKLLIYLGDNDYKMDVGKNSKYCYPFSNQENNLGIKRNKKESPKNVDKRF